MRIMLVTVPVLASLGGCAVHVGVNQHTTRPAAVSEDGSGDDWRAAETGILENHVQLTFPRRFVKAGESYFSPDDRRIVFQAIERPSAGETAQEFYAMFVADIERSAEGRITGLSGIRRISPRGSANTCGWFDPRDPGVVIFASTIGPPTASSPPGYQRSSGRYRWMFPPEMRIVRCRLSEADGTAGPLEVLVDRDAYVAEGSLTRDGRHLLYCSLESGQGDIYALDLETGRTTLLVGAHGYDGGPFFSPDEQRICYRSDRRGDHLLQLFVAELAYNERGEIVGIEREYQLTNNDAVNWCPFWHPGGRHLVYATSEIGHHNYEVFFLDADPGDLPGSSGTLRYGTGRRRVTHAEGSDVLPAFSSDGSVMIWTSRRGSESSVQLWAADFVMDVDRAPSDGGRHGGP